MSDFNPSAFGSTIENVLREPRLPELGPGTPNEAMRTTLSELTLDTMIPEFRDHDMAMACLSGLWLYHDFLEQSHHISQDLDTPTGSYWHAIMHRREPDPSNSKYWWRHVGSHPVFGLLEKEFGAWDASAFVDRCEACRGTGSADEMECRRIQLREWQILFEWCFQNA